MITLISGRQTNHLRTALSQASVCVILWSQQLAATYNTLRIDHTSVHTCRLAVGETYSSSVVLWSRLVGGALPKSLSASENDAG